MAKIKYVCVKSYSLNYKKSSGKSKTIEHIEFVEGNVYTFNKIKVADEVYQFEFLTERSTSIVFESSEFYKYFLEKSKFSKTSK